MYKKNFLTPEDCYTPQANKSQLCGFNSPPYKRNKQNLNISTSVSSSASKVSLKDRSPMTETYTFNNSFSTHDLTPLLPKHSPNTLSKGLDLYYKLYPLPQKKPIKNLTRQKTVKINYDFSAIEPTSKSINGYGSIVFKRALFRIMLDPMITPHLAKKKTITTTFAKTTEDSHMKTDIEKILENLQPLRKRRIQRISKSNI